MNEKGNENSLDSVKVFGTESGPNREFDHISKPWKDGRRKLIDPTTDTIS